MLDSLVRVSRRVGWVADSGATDHRHHSLLPSFGIRVHPVVRAQLDIRQPQTKQPETQASAVGYSTETTKHARKRGHWSRGATVGNHPAFSWRSSWSWRPSTENAPTGSKRETPSCLAIR